MTDTLVYWQLLTGLMAVVALASIFFSCVLMFGKPYTDRSAA